MRVYIVDNSNWINKARHLFWQELPRESTTPFPDAVCLLVSLSKRVRAKHVSATASHFCSCTFPSTPPHLPLSDFSSTPSFPPSLLYPFPSLLHSGVAMGRGILCCLPEPIDYDADVNLFHFELHRAIGKGAFGKVRSPLISLSFNLGFKLGITSSGPSCGTQEIKETLCS